MPAARALPQRAIRLSAELSVPLVILCSREANAENIAERVKKTFGVRGLVIQIQGKPELLPAPLLTADSYFTKLSADRSSDLSVKRNLGLRLARLRGWSKILFIDDDISHIRSQDVTRLACYLDSYPVAAMASRTFPDNSVVCHARRQARFKQDVFVSGAVLGVNAQHPDSSFFPDIYNEDWLFFSRYAAERSLAKIGEVRQDEYKPFANPERAAREEFGDVLAEGLYALFERTPGWTFKEQLAAATAGYWQNFQEDRRTMIEATATELERRQATATAAEYRTSAQALVSLSYATDYLKLISPGDFVDFISSWREDEGRWQKMMAKSRTGLSEREALDELGLTSSSIPCGYGSEQARERAKSGV